jgi:RNA polymerase sigma-70 factor (ECF subfamily)
MNDVSLLTQKAFIYWQVKVDDQKLLMLALSKLLENEMQLIELRFFEERSFAEVGAIAGITENHAKVKVYRILSKLKLLLKGSRK